MKKALVPIGIGLVVVIAGGAFAIQSMRAKASDSKPKVPSVTVGRGEIVVTVVENGTIDAVRSVDVKGRVAGRLAKLLVEEGDTVTQGQLIAVIDPEETEFRVRQDEAQLRGAQSSVARSTIEISQREATARAAVAQAQARVRQLELEVKSTPELTSAAIAEAQTQLASAEANRERIVNGTHPTQRANAQAQVNEAAANLRNAELEFERQIELEKQGYTAKRNVDNARLNVDVAKVRLENARVALARLEGQLKEEVEQATQQIRQAQAALNRAKTNRVNDRLKLQELASAQADLLRAKAGLRDAEVLRKTQEQGQASVDQLQSILSDSRRQLTETEIRAPINGVVTKKAIQVGELATALSTFGAGTTIVRIEDRTVMRVKLSMNEIDVAKLRLGMPATVDVDALPELSLSGKVAKIAPASTAISAEGGAAATSTDAVVRYEVEIRLDNAPKELRSGMSAKCSLKVVDRQDVLIVPVDYVSREGKRAFAFLAPAETSKDQKATRVEVKLGAQSGTSVEVISGIKENDKLVKPDYKGPARKGMMSFGPEEE
ncbi:MAG: HlyD family efflux transporter periplasmic adaptor subunit [Fimbriimonadaceae bacterium]|nr:HlyD family efflux transporter periplasmic adaptor subunit [Fimbriimonadaceae bacterium]